MFVTRFFLALGLVLIAGSAPAAEATAPVAPGIDLSALQYYASRHEMARVDAEIKRLRALHPGWQPPEDPAAIVLPNSAAEEQPLWELFAADKIDELKAEIARRRKADPSFAPPDDLMAKLALKEAKRALVAASIANNSAAAAAIADKTPALAGSADLEASWLAAAAYARTGAMAKALTIDRTILTDVQDPAARLATIRKAMAYLSPDDLQSLLTMGNVDSSGRSEFDVVSLELIRQHAGRILAGARADELSATDAKQLEDSAKAPNADLSDAALLGWLFSKKKDWVAASGWFDMALAAAPDPEKAGPADAKVALGAALALRESGRLPEAEALAYRWRGKEPALTMLYFSFVEPDLTRSKPAAIAPDRLEKFSATVGQQQWGDGAQALGWYAYNIGQLKPARAWFAKAMAWQPRDSTALGLALSLQRLDDKPALAAFLKSNRDLFPALASLAKAEELAARAGSGGGVAAAAIMAAAAKRKDYGGCLVLAARLAAAGRLDPAAAEQKGWCLLGLNRPQEATFAFASARNSAATRTDSAYGEALAWLRAGHSEPPVQAAGSVTLSNKRRSEVAFLALAVRATTAFDREGYEATLQALDQRRALTAEPRDLAMLRGWSLYHLGSRDKAQQVFATLDQQLSTPESRRGLSAATATPGR
jgi:hypothetical protein